MREAWLRFGGRIPLSAKQRIRRTLNPVRLGLLDRTQPVSDRGWARGTPVDRVYIEAFLERQRADVRGRVLEVKDSAYTRRFDSGVTGADVMDIDSSNPDATLVADLARPGDLPAELFDCVIITQTLQYVSDVGAAVRGLHRMLRPGGVVLATLPVISHLDSGIPGVVDRWRLSPAAAAEVFGAVFGDENTEVEGFGNVLTSIALLTGLAAEELSESDLWAPGPDHRMLVGVRAVKRPGGTA